jgi:hypothetical protein
MFVKHVFGLSYLKHERLDLPNRTLDHEWQKTWTSRSSCPQLLGKIFESTSCGSMSVFILGWSRDDPGLIRPGTIWAAQENHSTEGRMVGYHCYFALLGVYTWVEIGAWFFSDLWDLFSGPCAHFPWSFLVPGADSCSTDTLGEGDELWCPILAVISWLVPGFPKCKGRKPIQRWNLSPSRCRPWIGLWPFAFLFNWFVSKSYGMRAAQDTLLCSPVDGGSEALPLTKDKQLDPLSVVVTSMAPNSVKAGGKNYALSANVSKTGGTSSLR